MGAINWAWKIRGLKSNEKVLLLALADRGDKDSGVCTSSIERLSRDCGGWTRQQTNRVLKRLEEHGLVVSVLRHPGTTDPSRIFTCQVTVDSETWRPAEGKGRRKEHEGYYVNIDKFNREFHYELIKAVTAKNSYDDAYVNCLSSLRPIEVGKGRLLCRIPNADFAREIWQYKDVVIEAAAKLQPSITKLRFIWDKPRKTK